MLQRVTPCVPTFRLFGIKCAKCNMGFCSSDLVMRARGDIYHLECFRCSVCSGHLLPGDQFCVRDGELLCRAEHSLLLERASAGSPLSPRPLRVSGERGTVELQTATTATLVLLDYRSIFSSYFYWSIYVF